ncbi:MAG: ABC transporter ATP-binding protein/permease [Actinobacteria bacterium]|nr:ABC transporter ATP-binding protein/permease [Actinomycetota bacterium]
MNKLLLTYLKPYRKELLLVVALVLVQTFANLFLPDLNARIINNGVVTGNTGYILRTGGYMLGVAFVLGAASIAAVYLGSKIAMAFGRDARSALFRKVESFSQREINKFGTPSLITRNTNDVQQVQMMVAVSLTVMLGAPLMIVGGIVMALRQDVPLTLSLAVILPVMGAVLYGIGGRAIPLFRSMQTKIDRINQVMRETLSGIRVIRAFARTEQEHARFDEANLDLTDTGLRVQRLFALMLPALMLVFNFSSVAIMYFGGQRIAGGHMQVGNLTAFVTYVMQILMSVLMATMLAMMVPRAAACGDRIQQVLEVEPSISDPMKPVFLAGLDGGRRGVVEFKNVEFRYPGAQDPVLSGISFTMYPGQTTAVVGSTGSGKSTLISLIPRFYDVTSGSIEIDGIDIRDLQRDELWKEIGFVPQKAFLFSGTVASNLRFGSEEATDDDLWAALAIAQAHDFVSETEEQLEAPIAQGGTNVSGGQRQRLAIARALVKRAPIYVFDDSFSALDFRTDSLLRAALKREVADATVIIVAQRVSTILHADQIIVLERGTIAGLGTHQELMNTSDTYREIVYSQLSEDEVA